MGWGSSTRRGGGRKVRALPRKFVFLGFRSDESGMSQEFCRDVPDPWGGSKSLRKKVCAHFSFPKSFCFCCVTWLGKTKPKNIKTFGGTPPFLDRSHLGDVSRLSCGNVWSVPQTFCPIHVDLHRI